MSLAQTFGAATPDLSAIRIVAEEIAKKIRNACGLVEIVLFGSAADGTFHFGSDIDLLLIFETAQDLSESRQKLRAIGSLHRSIPIDLIFVSRAEFLKKQDIGGVCFIAKHEGIPL